AFGFEQGATGEMGRARGGALVHPLPRALLVDGGAGREQEPPHAELGGAHGVEQVRQPLDIGGAVGGLVRAVGARRVDDGVDVAGQLGEGLRIGQVCGQRPERRWHLGDAAPQRPDAAARARQTQTQRGADVAAAGDENGAHALDPATGLDAHPPDRRPKRARRAGHVRRERQHCEAMLAFRFDNSYARLPERFYARLAPTPVRDPRVVKVNVALAETLGLDAEALASPDAAQVFSGNVLPAGAEPLAQAYAGHQFGAFVRQLGDGRAILLGEVVGVDGVRRDVQLKGAGRTPFSRGGDGRSALGPVLREYVVSEAMAALGVPTTRSLAAVTTGEQVVRERLLPGAVLTRVAQSHLRVGTFEYFAARADHPALAALTEYALQRHYPSANVAARAHAALALLEGVIEAQAALIPLWMG